MEDLTPEERRILDDVEQENVLSSTERYAMDPELQRTLVGVVMMDSYFVLQSMGLIRPEYFTSEVHQALVRVVFDYYDRYKEVPLRAVVNREVEAIIARKPPETQMRWRSETAMVYDYYVPGLEGRDYLLDEITDFAKDQALKQAFFRCVDVMQKRKRGDHKSWVAKCHDILNKAMTVERDVEMGLDYFNTVEERYERMASRIKNNEIFKLGLESIDNALTCGGLCRGELGAVIGISGTGKSLFLVNAAVQAIKRGKKVLVISLEIDQDGTAQRFDAHFMSMFGQKMPTKDMMGCPDIVAQAVKEYTKGLEDPRQLIIKQFPAGEMSIADFRAYYAQTVMRGFKPDLVIVDYVGEMEDLPDMPTWESRYKLVRSLRAFAMRENVCVLTAMQPNKSAEEVNKLGDVIDQSNLGDAYAQIKPLDAFWSINQTRDEKAIGLARIFVAKHRNGESRFWFPVKLDKVDLSFTEIFMSTFEKMKKDYLNNKAETAQDRVANDIRRRKVDDVIGDVNSVCTGGSGMATLSKQECGDYEPIEDAKAGEEKKGDA